MEAENIGGATEAAKEYASGFAAGVATVVTGHPFDTVKVRLQTHNTVGGVRTYRNSWHCATRLLADEGDNVVLLELPFFFTFLKGLYKGASPSFIGVALESSLVFGVYSQMKQLLQGGEAQTGRPQLQVILPSAAFGGALISFILCPAEFLKCRMQVQGTDSVSSNYVKYEGPLDCAMKTVKDEGLKGIFRGGIATFLRESIGNAVFFSTYEFTRYSVRSQINSYSSKTCQQEKALVDVGIGILSGGFAGIAFWSAVLPFDVAKTLIQTSPTNSCSRNPFYSLGVIYKRVGLRGCYAGVGPTFMRAFPANAAAVVAWELTAKILGLRRVQELEGTEITTYYYTAAAAAIAVAVAAAASASAALLRNIL